MTELTILEHAVARHHLARLRNNATPPEEFRQSARVVATLLAAAATGDLPVTTVAVRTPLEETTGSVLAGRTAAVPILRAGLVMVQPLLELIPHIEVRHVGLYRDEETAQPVRYYEKLPPHDPPDRAFILDPMLATGGSASAAVELLSEWGVNEIRLLAIIAAPEGIARLQSDCPHVRIFAGVVDRELNEQSFILPGLGDAGDRIFNTL